MSSAITYCDICLESHPTISCHFLENLSPVSDTHVLPKALASVPSILQVQASEIGSSFQVFASKIIAKGTQFGPLLAPILTEPNVSASSEVTHKYMVKSLDRSGMLYLDLSSLDQCNWMSLVRYAECDEDSNTVVYELNGQLYFLVTKGIDIGSELVITYSPGYRRFIEKMELICFQSQTKKDGLVSDSDLPTTVSLSLHTKSNAFQKSLSSWSKSSQKQTSPFESEEPFMKFAAHQLIHNYKAVGPVRAENVRRQSLRLTSNKISEAENLKEPKHNTVYPTLPLPYICDICEDEKEFSSAECLNLHLMKHTMNRRHKEPKRVNDATEGRNGRNSRSGSIEHIFRCLVCSKQLRSASSLSRHINYKHRELVQSENETTAVAVNSVPACQDTERLKCHDSSPECPFCRKKLDPEKSVTHQAICKELDRYMSGSKSYIECTLCTSFPPYLGIEEFRTHLCHHTHPLMCPGCQLRISSDESFKSHICEDFPCDGCTEVFGSFLDLRDHIKSIHGTADFYCFECAYPYVTQRGYLSDNQCWRRSALNSNQKGNNVHVTKRLPPSHDTCKKRIRNGQNGDFVCEVCGAHYTKFSSLKTHRRTHGPRQYECQTCGKQFHRQTLLTEHSFVHQTPQFSCEECGKKLKTRKALDVHRKIHTGMKQFVCDFDGCNKGFCQKGNLASHRLTHVPLEEKDFQCPYCSKRLASRESCNLHVKAHEEKPFKCQFCPKECVNESLLKKHQRVVHGSERYGCEFCPLIVKQKHTFRRHLVQKHPEFSEIWLSEGHLRQCLQEFDGSEPIRGAASRRKTIVVEVAAEEIVEFTETDQSLPMPGNIIGECEVAVMEAEQVEEDRLILSSADGTGIGTEQSELVLLHLDHDGEFVLSLEQELEESAFLKPD